MADTEPTQANIERAIGMLPYQRPASHATLTLARAYDAHDADKRAFSEVAKDVCELVGDWTPTQHAVRSKLAPFILPRPEPVDPLVKALERTGDDEAVERAWRLRNFLAEDGLELREKQP